MTFRPIAEANIPFEFSSEGDKAHLVGSTAVVINPPESFANFRIRLDDESRDYGVRVTVQSYSSIAAFGEDVSGFTFSRADTTQTQVPNQIEGDASEFVPSPIEQRCASFQYYAGSGPETGRSENWVMLIEVDVPEVRCQEIGPATRARVSAYTLDRVHVVRAVRTQRRCLIADFNGAIPKSRRIVRATWRCDSPWVTIMDTPEITTNGRVAQVSATLGNCGHGAVKCTVDLDNGEIYTQMFEVRVVDARYFDEPYNQPGPFVLQVSAP